ncbi:2Fe-2S iron-sulfur cluster-binding protein [Prosthecomicrobium pneumaticum]|uniref:CDP-4-dehydro-6-deoxyglucose reductase n=1 Tax=Prosthecomicrobium pneumaticum TaxID=81895 RepID=A0A7W9FR05_9HYPH|nr:2Fe-2S iron-sulfur cluster-binding protein [Prosthecomicrobium pneumaticum]MBB5755299.1 CDP-4-dehydro-6-deoxyglucose reductase [Prosthecomicrobium pneumaticum]
MSYRVTLLEDALAFDVEPHETLLAAALRADINLPHDCKSGTCGTCRFRIVEGTVDYLEPPMGLDPEERAAGFGLACQARPASDLVAEIEVMPSLVEPPARHRATVRAVERLAADVVHLALDLPEAARCDYLPGQYVNIHFDDGRSRSFSMAAPPRGRTIELHVRQIPGGAFTERRIATLAPGDALDIELPHGSFFLRKDDFRPLLMVATGTGLAPVKSILESLMDDPDCPPVALYWGARTKADLYLHAAIEAWAGRFDDFRYVPVLSRPDADWDGRRGYVQDAVLADFPDLSEQAIYLCGSPTMVGAAKSLFLSNGASVNHIYADSFLFQHNRSAG